MVISLIILTTLPTVALSTSAFSNSVPSSYDSIRIVKRSIVVPNQTAIYLTNLVKSGVVEGIVERDTDYDIDYSLTSQDYSNVTVNKERGYISFNSPCTAIVTFTHKELQEISVSIEMIVKYSPARYVSYNMGKVYVDGPKTLIIPERYMSLGDFVLSKRTIDGGDIDFKMNGNEITITGISKGSVYLTFDCGYVSSSIELFVVDKPIADNVKVNESTIIVPTGFLYLNNLVEQGVIEGLPERYYDYNITSSVTSGVNIDNIVGYIEFSSPCTTVITCTSKLYPHISFSIEVIVKKNTVTYVTQNTGTVYIGEPKTLVIPDDYIPLSEFSISKECYNEDDFEFEIKGNEITITGLSEKIVALKFDYKYGASLAPITILEKPSSEKIKVTEKKIVVPTLILIYLSSLIENGVMEGVSGDDSDYNITFSKSFRVIAYNQYGYFYFSSPVTNMVTYTHKDFPEVSFSIEMVAKSNPADYISNNLGTVNVGMSKTLTIPEDYMSLRDFTVEKGNGTNYPNADFDFEIDGNEITITGVSEGLAYIRFTNKSGSRVCTINIAPIPSGANIVVHKPSIVVPTDVSILLSSLIENGVIEGVPGGYKDYRIVTSKSDGVTVYNQYGYCYFTSPTTSTITYTHKDFPDLFFSIEMKAKNSPGSYLRSNLGTMYIGESETLTIPDDCLPLNDFIIYKEEFSSSLDADFNFDIKDNVMIITGLAEGSRNLNFKHKYGTDSYSINILEKPSVDKIVVNKPSIVVPTQTDIYLGALISNGIVEGISDGDSNYIISSPDSSGITIYNGFFYFTSPEKSTINFTNKKFPNLFFSIEITAQDSPASYLSNNIGTVYIGESRTMAIPDEYLPINDFTIKKGIIAIIRIPNLDLKSTVMLYQ